MPLRCNIDCRGRLLRLIAAAALGAAAVWRGLAALQGWNLALVLALGAASAFVLFEAAAGWCAARACGLRIPF